MPLPIEKKVAQAFADYKKHTDGIYRSTTLAKYQKMREAVKDGDVKAAVKIGKQVHKEVIDQGERQMRHADRINRGDRMVYKDQADREDEKRKADAYEYDRSVGAGKYASKSLPKYLTTKVNHKEEALRHEKKAKALEKSGTWRESDAHWAAAEAHREALRGSDEDKQKANAMSRVLQKGTRGGTFYINSTGSRVYLSSY